MYPTGIWASIVGVAMLSYLLGSLNFALIISRLLVGDDIRKHGSGNAGMTNILRTYGKRYAVFTALGDFAKALVAIGIAKYIFYRVGLPDMMGGYVSGIFVLLGHLYPLYFGFKGGKGVMVSLGIMFITNPWVFIVILIIFVPVIFITKIVSMASVLGALAYPVLTYVMHSMRGIYPVYDTILAAIMAGIVLVKHRDNIKRLLNGTENKFGTKKQ